MSAVKERPFSDHAAKIPALLDGRRTQIRRLVKPQPMATGATGGALLRIVPSLLAERGLFDVQYDLDNPKTIRCPLGAVGDRLWLREAWNMRGLMFGKPAEYARFAAKPGAFHYQATDTGAWRKEWGGWRRGVTMPREASRLTVEITDVRVERVQDITENDAVAEGEHPFFERFACFTRDQCISSGERAIDSPYRASFAVTWDEENGDRLPGRASLWSSNPWVFAVTIRRVTP